MPDSIIGFHEAVVVDDLTDEEETAIAVILLRDNGEGTTREDGKACCHVTFLGRNLIKNAPLPVAGRDAEVQEFLENSLDVSVRCKSERGFGVATSSFSDEIIKLDVIDFGET